MRNFFTINKTSNQKTRPIIFCLLIPIETMVIAFFIVIDALPELHRFTLHIFYMLFFTSHFILFYVFIFFLTFCTITHFKIFISAFFNVLLFDCAFASCCRLSYLVFYRFCFAFLLDCGICCFYIVLRLLYRLLFVLNFLLGLSSLYIISWFAFLFSPVSFFCSSPSSSSSSFVCCL